MSIEARCKFCGEVADIRFNFVSKEDEREYHENYICLACKVTQ